MRPRVVRGKRSATASPELHPADLGARLREVRLQQGLTLERLARSAEMSKSAISQIESGRIDPSLQTLRRLATCLQTPLASLFESRTSIDQRVVRRGQRKVFRMPRNRLRYELLTPDLQGKRVEFLRVEFEPDGPVVEEPYAHEGEEYGFVIQGNVEVHVDGTLYRLGPGDSIFFPAKLPHYVRGAGRRKAVMIWAISPPSY
jgi:transcriptional regulator with XRE-family HTH domain